MARPIFLQGTYITPDSVHTGHFEVADGEVVSIRKGAPPKGAQVLAKGIILPRFFNAHMHIGDSFLYPAPKMSVERLVGPPDGYKHKRLRKAKREELVAGMQRAYDDLLAGGAWGIIDFREGGMDGMGMARDAYESYPLSNLLAQISLGRPKSLAYDAKEVRNILKTAPGLGISAYSDWDFGQLRNVARAATVAKKFFAIHASEIIREPMEKVLDLKPKMLIHLTKATPSDLELVKDAEIPVVVCARANRFFGIKNNLKALVRSGVTLMGGTDNAMINRPFCIDEMRYIIRSGKKSGLTPKAALEMFTTNGSKVLNYLKGIPGPRPERPGLVVCSKWAGMPKTFDPYGMLGFLRARDVKCVVQGETIYYTKQW